MCNVVRSIDTGLTAAERPRPGEQSAADQGHTLATVGKKETTLWDVKTGARLHALASSQRVQMASARRGS
jgi:hypothetical protein